MKLKRIKVICGAKTSVNYINLLNANPSEYVRHSHCGSFISIIKMEHNSEELKLLILNSKEPLLFKHLLTSEILKWNLCDWESKLKDRELEFRLGKFEYTSEPQWESKTRVIKSSFKYLLHYPEIWPESGVSQWLYFDYKYLNNWFTDVEELRNCIDWSSLGFPNVNADDCTIWIGTKGAHTPCHIDTYGFNLIFQVYGRKQWIVAPPEENLRPTRIPYEESSIYSKLNFFSPNVKDFKGVNNCRKIILNPGEVLYLPHRWWHYVENLDTAISINVWIPQPEDDEERLHESIVQLFVKQLVNVSDRETVGNMLNPNMCQPILNNDVNDMLEMITSCKRICKNKSQNKKKIKREDSTSIEYTSEGKISEILQKYKTFVEEIPKMSQKEFNDFLEKQKDRFKNTGEEKVECMEENDILEVLNVFTDNDVISLICEKLLKQDN